MSYLAGLYDKDTRGSLQIKPYDQNWEFMVIYWNDTRITNVAFVGSDPPRAVESGSGSVQILHRPTHKQLWIIMKVFAMFPKMISTLIRPRACSFPESIPLGNITGAYCGTALILYHGRTSPKTTKHIRMELRTLRSPIVP